MFLTREEEYKTLDKRVNSFIEGYRQNIALIGPTLSGKTYFIEQFLEDKYLNEKTLPVYADLEYLSFSEFVRIIFTCLLFNFTKKQKGRSLDNLDLLILESEKSIPKTTEKMKNTLGLLALSQKINFDSVTEVLDEFISETQIKLLLVVDNFTLLKDFPKKLVSEFTKYIIAQKNIMFIFISGKIKEAELILSQELNILFGSFEKIYLENLSHQEALYCIDTRLQDKLDANSKKFLIELTDGFPFYLEIIIQDLLDSSSEKIDSRLLVTRLSNLLIDPGSCLYQIFMNKINRIKLSFKDKFLINPLLILIAQGYTRKKDLLALLKIDSQNLNAKLAKLLEINTLNKSGSFYFIPDKLFSFWVCSVFKIGITAPLIFHQDRKASIENKLLARLEEFKQADSQDNLQRFIDLVHLFKDDTVKTGKKSISLPHIKRLKIVPAHNEEMKFIIGEAKEYYLILAFKENSPEDTDILEFSNRCSYFRNKQPKKIFITLKKADVTAKLLAKEKRLFFWEREDVNLLLRLYNQPSII
ncbi:MAG: ATP-binding protein [Candidatus Omnitrophica bacterium]|nr:ATP-binding protein [Candidatus Omnitrophota bacterium]